VGESAFCLDSLLTSSSVSNLFRMLRLGQFSEFDGQNTLPSPHQPSLAIRVPERISFKLAVMMYRSIHCTSPSYIRSCFTHDILTTAAVFYLSSSGRSAGSSLYSRQAGVSGFWCHRLERPASPRRISAVTRGFQTTT